MTEPKQADPGEELRRAREVVERQAAEIASLQASVADQQFADKVRSALVLAATSGAIAAPLTQPQLLELLVRTAMHVTAAESGALFLIDDEAQELEFKVALGPHSAATRVLRVPLGHGIAGLVAATGQPMNVADAEHDPRRAADIAQAVGFTPRNILCAPLLVNDRVIGVLEMLDKAGARSFAPGDLETLGLFAEQAALAIEQSFAVGNVWELLSAALGDMAGTTDEEKRAFRQDARSFARHLESAPLYDRALHLALLVREIAGAGKAELTLCETILQGFAEYLRSRSATISAAWEPPP